MQILRILTSCTKLVLKSIGCSIEYLIECLIECFIKSHKEYSISSHVKYR